MARKKRGAFKLLSCGIGGGPAPLHSHSVARPAMQSVRQSVRHSVTTRPRRPQAVHRGALARPSASDQLQALSLSLFPSATAAVVVALLILGRYSIGRGRSVGCQAGQCHQLIDVQKESLIGPASWSPHMPIAAQHVLPHAAQRESDISEREDRFSFQWR